MVRHRSPYQWIRGVDELPNGTEATLQLTDVNATASGTYRVRVHNAGGDALSGAGGGDRPRSGGGGGPLCGLTLNGAVGGQYKIEAASALPPDIWAPIAELTLTNASQLWFDLGIRHQPDSPVLSGDSHPSLSPGLRLRGLPVGLGLRSGNRPGPGSRLVTPGLRADPGIRSCQGSATVTA